MGSNHNTSCNQHDVCMDGTNHILNLYNIFHASNYYRHTHHSILLHIHHRNPHHIHPNKRPRNYYPDTISQRHNLCSKDRILQQERFPLPKFERNNYTVLRSALHRPSNNQLQRALHHSMNNISNFYSNQNTYLYY